MKMWILSEAHAAGLSRGVSKKAWLTWTCALKCKMVLMSRHARTSEKTVTSVHYNSRPSAIFRANGSDGRRVYFLMTGQ